MASLINNSPAQQAFSNGTIVHLIFTSLDIPACSIRPYLTVNRTCFEVAASILCRDPSLSWPGMDWGELWAGQELAYLLSRAGASEARIDFYLRKIRVITMHSGTGTLSGLIHVTSRLLTQTLNAYPMISELCLLYGSIQKLLISLESGRVIGFAVPDVRIGSDPRHVRSSMDSWEGEEQSRETGLLDALAAAIEPSLPSPIAHLGVQLYNNEIGPNPLGNWNRLVSPGMRYELLRSLSARGNLDAAMLRRLVETAPGLESLEIFVWRDEEWNQSEQSAGSPNPQQANWGTGDAAEWPGAGGMDSSLDMTNEDMEGNTGDGTAAPDADWVGDTNDDAGHHYAIARDDVDLDRRWYRHTRYRTWGNLDGVAYTLDGSYQDLLSDIAIACPQLRTFAFNFENESQGFSLDAVSGFVSLCSNLTSLQISILPDNDNPPTIASIDASTSASSGILTKLTLCFPIPHDSESPVSYSLPSCFSLAKYIATTLAPSGDYIKLLPNEIYNQDREDCARAGQWAKDVEMCVEGMWDEQKKLERSKLGEPRIGWNHDVTV